MCAHLGICAICTRVWVMCLWMSEENFWELVLSLSHVGFGIELRFSGLVGRTLVC